MKITLISFGYKHTKTKELYIQYAGSMIYIYNLRSTVRNPWNIGGMRKLTGLDKPVQDLVYNCIGYKKNIHAKVLMQADRFKQDLMIALGCTGGKHRSVAAVEILAADLRTKGYEVEVIHRDLNKGKDDAIAA